MAYKGKLIPSKLTTAERDAISSPVEGEVIYNTTTKELNRYNGTTWDEVGGGGGGDSICIPLGGNNDSKAVGRDVTNQVVKEFIYKGATKTMTLVEVVVDRGLLASVTVEVYDYTNALSICSATTTTAGKLILDLGTISNLPTANAIFQLRVSTGTGGNNNDAFFYVANIEL